mgnify:FL=1
MIRTIFKDHYPFATNDSGPMAHYDKGYRAVVCVEACGYNTNQYWWSPKFATREGAEQFDLTQHILKLNGLI